MSGQTINGTAGNDTLQGGSGNDTISTGAGTDLVAGYGGDDLIRVDGVGDKSINGGIGNDRLEINIAGGSLAGYTIAKANPSGGTLFTFAKTGGTIQFQTAGDISQFLSVNGKSYQWNESWGAFWNKSGDLTEVVRATGTSQGFDPQGLNPTWSTDRYLIYGSETTQVLRGGFGSDTILGGAQTDYIDGGGGADSIKAGGGDDFVFLSANALTQDALIDGGTGKNTLVFRRLRWQSNQVYDSVGDGPVSFSLGALSAKQLMGLGGYSSGVLGGTTDVPSFTGLAPYVATSTNLTNFSNVIGSEYADIIEGDGSDNILVGGRSADSLSGGAGNDAIYGDDDYSLLNYASQYVNYGYWWGGQFVDGRDTLLGGAGDDTLSGGGSDDVLDGGTGRDSLTGGSGYDSFILRAGDGGSTEGAADVITDFEDGIDVIALQGLSFSQLTLTQQSGDVLISVTTGGEKLAVVKNMTLANFNALDFATGTAAAVSLVGTPGNDTLQGGSGNDTISTGAGTDLVAGYGGDDLIRVDGVGDKSINGGIGNDRLEINIAGGSLAGYTIAKANPSGGTLFTFAKTGGTIQFQTAGDISQFLSVNGKSYQWNESWGAFWNKSGDLTEVVRATGTSQGFDPQGLNPTWSTDRYLIYGSETTQVLRGGFGSDTILGGAQTDYIDGGGGADSIKAGGGDDFVFLSANALTQDALIDGGTGKNTLVFRRLRWQSNQVYDSVGDGPVSFSLGALSAKQLMGLGGYSSGVLGGTTDVPSFTGLAPYVATSTNLTNFSNVIGSEYADIIEGDGSDNILVGGRSADSLSGGAGNDAIYGDDDYSLLNYASQYVNYGYWWGGQFVDGRDTLLGGAGDDTLSGGGSDDVLDGGTGRDSLTGGSGYDSFILRAGDGGPTEGAADVITDFEDGIDVIALQGLSFSQLTLTQQSGDVLISVTTGGEKLAVVKNMTLANFNALDFATGPLSPGSGSSVVGDTTAPTAPQMLRFADDVGSVTGMFDYTPAGVSTDDNKPILQIAAESGSSVRVYRGTELLGYAVETTTPGQFSYPVTNAFPVGTNTLTATATDAAGNTSPLSAEFKINVIAQTPGVVLPSTAAVESLVGQDGDDTFVYSSYSEFIDGSARPVDVIDGKGGFDTIRIDGPIQFDPAHSMAGIKDVERLQQNSPTAGRISIDDDQKLASIRIFDFSTSIGASLNFQFKDVNEDLTLIGGAGSDSLWGGWEDDVIAGRAGDDDLRGGPGNDVLAGGAGRDTLVGGDGNNDASAFFSATQGVIVDLAAGSASGEGIDRLVGIEAAFGSFYADTFIGNAADNFFEGGPGNDTYTGGAGNDVFIVQARPYTYYVDGLAQLANLFAVPNLSPSVLDATELETILDFTAGDAIEFADWVESSNAFTPFSASNLIPTLLGAQQLRFDTLNGSAVIYVGRDQTPGADLTIALPGVNPSQLRLVDSQRVVVDPYTASISALKASDVRGLAPARIATLTTTDVRALSTSVVSAMLPSQVAAFSTSNVGALQTDQLRAIDRASIPGLETQDVAVLKKEQIQALSTEQVRALVTDQIRGLNSTTISYLTSAQVAALMPSQIEALNPVAAVGFTKDNATGFVNTQAAKIGTAVLSRMTPDAIRAINPGAFSQFGSDQLISLTDKQFGVIASSQLGVIEPGSLRYIETRDIAVLQANQSVGFVPSQIPGIQTSQVSAFSTSGLGGLTPESFKSLNTEQLAAFTVKNIAGLTSQQLIGLTYTGIQALEPADLPGLTIGNVPAVRFGELTSAQLAAITPAQAALINARQLGAVPPERLESIGVEDVAVFSSQALAGITTAQIRSFSTAQINRFGGTDGKSIVGLSTDAVYGLGSAQITALSTQAFKALTSAQLAAIAASNIDDIELSDLGVIQAASFAAFGTAQLRELSSAQMQVLTEAQVKALSTGQIAAFTSSQLAAMGVAGKRGLGTAGMAFLTPTALSTGDLASLGKSVANLSTALLTQLSTAQLAAAMTATAVKALGASQLAALPPEKMAALPTGAIAALNSAQVKSLSTDQLRAMGTQQVAALSKTGLGSFGSAQVAALDSAQLAAIPTKTFAALSGSQVSAISTSVLAALPTANIRALTANQVSGLSTDQVKAMSTSQMSALSSKGLAGLGAEQLGAMGTDQIAAFAPTAIKGLGSSQFTALGTAGLAALSTGSIATLSNTQVSNLSPAQVGALGTGQLQALSSKAIKGLDAGQLEAIGDKIDAVDPADVAVFTSAQLAALTTGQLNEMTTAQFARISPKAILGLSAGDLAYLVGADTANLTALSSAVYKALTPEQMPGLDLELVEPAKFGLLSAEAIAGLTSTQLDDLSPSQLEKLPAKALAGLDAADFAQLGRQSDATALYAALSATQLKAITAGQAPGLDVSLLQTGALTGLSAAALGALTTAQLIDLDPNQWGALAPAALAGLDETDFALIAQQSDADTIYAAFTGAQLKALSPEQIQGIGDGDFFDAMTSSELQTLSASQLKAISTAALVTIEASTLAKLANKQLPALSADQLRSLMANPNSPLMALSSTQYALLTTTDIPTLLQSPLVLDLDGDGARSVSLAAGVRFDMTGDGQTEATGWVSAGDALLVRDVDRDGAITHSGELFGERTVLADGRWAQDGFEALASLDSNADGQVDAKDAAFEQLMLWQDSNQDGLSQPDELVSLTEAGIAAIATGAQASSRLDAGNWVGLEGQYTRRDGSTGAMADIWFRVQVQDALDERAQQLGEALTGYREAATAGTVRGQAGANPLSDTSRHLPKQPALAGADASTTANTNLNPNANPNANLSPSTQIGALGALLRAYEGARIESVAHDLRTQAMDAVIQPVVTQATPKHDQAKSPWMIAGPS